MSNDDSLMNDIVRMQNEFYANQNRNIFFKSKQKLDCAHSISNKMTDKQLELLMSKTAFIIPNTNKIYIDYITFKMYGNPEIYEEVNDYLISIISECIQKYGTYDMHINLNTFTISAFQRYKPLIDIFANKCLNHETNFSDLLNKMYIYYTPSIMDNIIKILGPLFNNGIKNKLMLYSKNGSIPQPETDGTNGWIEVPDMPEAPGP